MPATYTFLPWLRQGISNEISQTDNFNAGTGPLGRANLQVDVNIVANSQSVESWQQAVPMIGPGDIVGLNKDVIIRHEPGNWITNFEPHHLPFIEFYDEDFPWRYSPAAPDGNRLRPWLYLLLLKPDEFKRGDPLEGPLPFIKLLINSGAFPDPAQTWAWAHVQVNKNLVNFIGADTEGDRLSDAQQEVQSFLSTNPDAALSRVIATRKLAPEQDYHAFLVPAFETGRLAGLGSEGTVIDDVEAQTASWGNGQTDYPFYHEFYFHTGTAGDFEHLVRQIMPRSIDTQVGRRSMDIQDPGYLLNRSEIDPTEILESQPNEDGTLWLEGALRVPENAPLDYPWEPNAGHFTPFVKRLEDLVNLGEDLLAGDFTNSENSYQGDPYDPNNLGIDDDPIVAPPMYGRWHSLTAKVDRTDAGWVHELNLDPRQRAIAGLGAKLIQDKQEDYMEQAWSQLGDVVEANSKINIAQLAAQVSGAIYGKHIRSMKSEQVPLVTSTIHSVIPAEDATVGTFFSQLTQSQLPNATLSPGFRKILRKNGPIGKKIKQVAAIDTANLLTDLGNATITAAPAVSISPAQNQVPIGSVNTWANAAATEDISESVFAFSSPGDTTTESAGNQEAQDFQESSSVFYEYFKEEHWELPGTGQVFDPGPIGGHIEQEIAPGVSIAPELADYIEVTNPTLPSHAQPMVPILAAPKFTLPVFEILKKDALEWFLPNLHLIPQNTISLLETNPKFIESLFVGMNHEMARELLWRGYPTDQRGSYFRNFWKDEDYVRTAGLPIEELEESFTDIPPIHAWASNTELGTHTKKTEAFDPTASSEGTEEIGTGKLVMVFRGDLLKKFPHVSIYAVKAEWDLSSPSGDSETIPSKVLGTESRYPIFFANLEPDLVFLGFDLTIEDAKGEDGVPIITGDDTEPYLPDPGWFFILQERPGELRFGLDVSAPDEGLQTWKDMYWKSEILTDGHIDLSTAISVGDAQLAPEVPSDLIWGPTSNAADIATILMQDPVKAAIHAREMLG